jgi:hypothetical protein
METLEVGLSVLFYYANARYGPHSLVCLNKPFGGGVTKWNVMVCICLTQGVALLVGVVLLE